MLEKLVGHMNFFIVIKKSDAARYEKKKEEYFLIVSAVEHIAEEMKRSLPKKNLINNS